jgi:hypothetical protein
MKLTLLSVLVFALTFFVQNKTESNAPKAELTITAGEQTEDRASRVRRSNCPATHSRRLVKEI